MNKFALNSFYCKFIEKSKDAYHINIISNLFVEEYMIFSIYCSRYNNNNKFVDVLSGLNIYYCELSTASLHAVFDGLITMKV